MEQTKEFVDLLDKLKFIASDLDRDSFSLLLKRGYVGHTKHCKSFDVPDSLSIDANCTCELIRNLILQMKRFLRIYKILYVKCNCWWCCCNKLFEINSTKELKDFLQREIPLVK